MARYIIPEELLPITHYQHKDGKYFSGDFLIPKHWTVYEREGKVVSTDGHLDLSKMGASDIKLVKKNNNRWYVAKENMQLDTPIFLEEVQSPKTSPRQSRPPSSVNNRGGKKSRTRRRNRRRNRRGTRRR